MLVENTAADFHPAAVGMGPFVVLTRRGIGEPKRLSRRNRSAQQDD
jgi:hypothetical protein